MTDSQELFSAVTRLTGDGLCLCEMIVDAAGDPIDYRFLEVNDRFEEYTGLKDAKGRTALELVPELEFHWIETYGRVGLGRETLRFENGSVPMGRWFEVHATPAEMHGQLMILFRDVSSRKVAEAEREKALEHTRRLVHELSHRVKNSLSIISSIVAMEARNSNEDLRQTLDRVAARISAVGGLYDAITEMGSVDEVAMSFYLDKIVDGLRNSIGSRDRLRIEASFADITLPSQRAIPLGLIVNELATNSIKHAFGPADGGTVAVSLGQEGVEGVLEIADDGCGLSGQGKRPQGLGARLVGAFVTDLGGQMEQVSTPRGTRTVIRFPIPGDEAEAT